MAQVAGSPLSVGDPGWAGTIHINLGGEEAEFHPGVECPGQRSHERRHHFKKNGHDTSVKGAPQQYYCHACGRSFYPHTSRFFHKLFGQLKRLLKRALKGGRLNLQQLAAKFDLSESAASRLLAALVRRLAELAETKRYKELPRGGKAIFCDETFLKIQGEQWYIVVLRNEQGKVLDAFLTKHRHADILLPHFQKALKRMARGAEVIVTDDFTAYQAVARLLEQDLVHVRCVHKPPYGRVIIDIIQWEGHVAHYTTTATISDVLKEGNTFLTRVSKHDKKQGKPGAKRGRPKNRKNRPKEVIAAEKAEKARKKAEKAQQEAEQASLAAKRVQEEAERARQAPGNAKQGMKTAVQVAEKSPQEAGAAGGERAGDMPPKRRGRKNYTKEGEVQVFHYDPKAREVLPRGESDQVVAKAFTLLLAFFAGKCITTNKEEEFFSTFKRLLHFSGWRTPEYWQELIETYVILRYEKGAVGHLVDLLAFRPHMLRKNLNKLISVTIPNTRTRRKN